MTHLVDELLAGRYDEADFGEVRLVRVVAGRRHPVEPDVGPTAVLAWLQKLTRRSGPNPARRPPRMPGLRSRRRMLADPDLSTRRGTRRPDGR